MAQPALDMFVRRAFELKIEATEGTDSLPVAATDGILILNGSSDTSFDKRVRPTDRSFLGNFPFSVANKIAFIEGDIELFCPTTPGTNKSANDVPLCIAGMQCTLSVPSKSTKYTPISANIPSASGYWFHSDQLIKVLGCRNDIKSIKMEVGQIFTAKVHIQGNYSSVIAQANDSPVVYTTVPITCSYDISTAGIKVGAGAEVPTWCKSLELILGNDLKSKEYTMVKKNMISGRAATWNMRIAKTALVDFNPWAVRDAGSTVTCRMSQWETGTFGLMTGKSSVLKTVGQIETVKPVEIDGDYGWDLSGPCIPTVAGNDEFSIEFVDNS